MDPEHKKFATQTEVLNSLRKEVRQMDSEIKLEEAALNNFKRTSTKIWMGIKFGGLVECSEKAAVRKLIFLNRSIFSADYFFFTSPLRLRANLENVSFL